MEEFLYPGLWPKSIELIYLSALELPGAFDHVNCKSDLSNFSHVFTLHSMISMVIICLCALMTPKW
jgi:hypothetical protein